MTRNWIETPSAYAIAAEIDCGTPDGPESVGAGYLVRCWDAAIEAIEWRADHEESLDDDDLNDSAWELADGLVPVYTHEMWQTFVDLAAYNEDVEDRGPFEDMTKQAMVCLFQIAERVFGLAFAAWKDEYGNG